MAKLDHAVGRILLASGKPYRATAPLSKASEAYAALERPLVRALLTLALAHAAAQRAAKDEASAVAELERALAIAERVDPEGFAAWSTLSELADVEHAMGESSEALARYERALPLVQKQRAADHPSMALASRHSPRRLREHTSRRGHRGSRTRRARAPSRRLPTLTGRAVSPVAPERALAWHYEVCARRFDARRHTGENRLAPPVYDDYEPTTIRKVTRPDNVAENAEPHLIVLQGSSIGRLYKVVPGRYIIGRALEADIQFDDDGVSRRHAAIECVSKDEVRLLDLGSTNGTAVNGHRVTQHELHDADVILVGKGVVLKFTMQSEVEGEFARALYQAATRDALTGLFNRRPFEDQLAKDFAHATRHRSPLSVLVFDLDHFKSVNDTYGHRAGDRVLERIGGIVASSVRVEDLASRMGGEEFAIVMRDTPWDGARRLAERLRQLVESTVFDSDGTTIPVTISVGIASFDPHRHPEIGQLVEEADQAMYGAKRAGRNRVMAGPCPTEGVAAEAPVHQRTTRQ